MCLKMSEIWHACPVFLSSCCSLAHSTLPATMKSHFVLPSYLTPLTEKQKNKLWYNAKASERIVWVPGQQSRVQVSFQFKVSFFICFLLSDGLENLKQCEQTEMKARSQGVDLSLTTGRKQECCWMETGAWWHSCTFMLLPIQKRRNPEKISLSLTISLAVVHPLAGWQSRDVGDHEGLFQLFHFSSEEHFYLKRQIVKKLELLLLWRIHTLFLCSLPQFHASQ